MSWGIKGGGEAVLGGLTVLGSPSNTPWKLVHLQPQYA